MCVREGRTAEGDGERVEGLLSFHLPAPWADVCSGIYAGVSVDVGVVHYPFKSWLAGRGRQIGKEVWAKGPSSIARREPHVAVPLPLAGRQRAAHGERPTVAG